MPLTIIDDQCIQIDPAGTNQHEHGGEYELVLIHYANLFSDNN